MFHMGTIVRSNVIASEMEPEQAGRPDSSQSFSGQGEIAG
jgi:hypothetical protein